MSDEYDIAALAQKIAALKQAAMELRQMAGGIKVVERNVDRILADVRLLELGISDVVGIV